MNTPLSNEVLAAWHDNRKVEAIKLLREQTGLGLKESKDLLESLDSTGSMPRPITADEQDLAKQQLREQLEKMGVKDADALLDSMGHGSDGSGGSSFTSVTRTSKTVNGKTTSTLSATGNPEAAAQLLMSTSDMELEEARAQIDAAMKNGQKLEAIKRLKDITGLGLAEAKDHIDAAMAGEPLDWHVLPVRKANASATPSASSSPTFQANGYAPGEVPRGQSKPWWILVLIVLAVAGWYYFKSA